MEEDEEPFVPVIPTFPTPSNISEEEAYAYCRNQITGSQIYQSCKNAIGDGFEVEGYIEQCVADIQVSEYANISSVIVVIFCLLLSVFDKSQ